MQIMGDVKNVPLLLIGLSLMLTGCRYDMTANLTENGGQVYRLDRLTGDLSAVDDGALKPIATASNNSMELPTNLTGSEQDLSGTGAKATFEGKWRDGKLFYKVDLSPYNKLTYARDNSGSITVIFLDADNYEVEKFSLNLSQMIAVVNESGAKESLNYTGRKAMSRSDFEAVGSWQISWAFPER